MTSLRRRLEAMEEKHRPSLHDPAVWAAKARHEQRFSDRVCRKLSLFLEHWRPDQPCVWPELDDKPDPQELADLDLLTRAGLYPPKKLSATEARAARERATRLIASKLGLRWEDAQDVVETPT